MIGEIIAEEYRVEELIGEGTFGEVYRCTDLNLDRTLALKFLKKATEGSTEFRRFQAEARHLGALDHPNVVKVHRLGSHEGIPYIAMEFVLGRPLRAVMRDASMPLSRAAGIMAHVARGLSALHDIDVVHRDLSPNNIMVREDDHAKILDLGLAKDLNTGTVSSVDGRIVGTFKYMSPEQLEGCSLTPASDNFSLATIIYELIAGTHPFEAEHHMSVMYAICHRRHTPLHEAISICPRRLSDILDLYLAKDPLERSGDLERLDRELMLASEDISDRELTRTVTIQAPTQSSSVMNPYLNRTMLKRRSDFFGRELELRRIYSRLNASTPGSISVVGDRKIGKSSLLNYVYMRRTRDQHLEHPDQTIMVFLDFQEQKDLTLEGFASNLLGMAELELKGKFECREHPRTLEGIKGFVQEMDSEGFKLILLMDEFEAITDNPNFELEFFSFLRYLANHYNVAYLTSSARDLQVLCHAKEIRDSPFFNIFTALRLGSFKREEAMQLIREPSARVGYPLEDYSEQLLGLAGALPFYLQVACSHAVEYLQENTEAKELDFPEISRRYYEEAILHFRHAWSGLDDDEKSVIRRVQSGKRLPESLEHVGEELARRELLSRVSEKFQLFSESFGGFVKSECRPDSTVGFLGRLLGRGRSS